ncbi:MAG: hypothetical protein GXO26_08935 [Crenarchaeota archaeon]|nr:hypothetical protein [Thermoproteota archaeon]
MVFRTIVFSKKVRKDRQVDIARFYLFLPSPRSRPLFEAKVRKGDIVWVLRGLRAEYEDKGNTIILSSDDPHSIDKVFRRIILFSGIRQFLNESSSVESLIKLTINLPEFEVLFWFSKLINLYEIEKYWGVLSVAKAFRQLYGI